MKLQKDVVKSSQMKSYNRIKTPKLVILFNSTTQAMAMENICAAHFGRLIPVPSELSSGCGLAFCAEPEFEKELIRLMKEHGIYYQNKAIIELY